MKLHEEIIKNYIKSEYSEISESVLNTFLLEIKEKIDNFISDEKNKENLFQESALELSSYSQVYEFLKSEISYDDILRYKSIDWENVQPCNGQSAWDLRRELKQACKNKDVNSFIGCLNAILGNCCISTDDDLD